ncbi:MAG: hypothetical protein EZS28_000888 [Streblomastix strix]|uniref:Uncharacterized protein n=1 Tax=Streblomastix strix TaxID=222440 RepID=A0A5J4X9X5_9EUKA|nr:MAG: hypothetical protein EZS28_000888 [Streblomastix strix]
MTLEQQQLTRDGCSPASFEELLGQSYGGASGSIDSPNRQQDSRIFSVKMEGVTSDNVLCTSNFTNIVNITNPKTDYSQPWTGEQGCRLIESPCLERELRHQPADTNTINESNILLSRNKSLSDSNLQTMSKILLAVNGSTRSRKKGAFSTSWSNKLTFSSSTDRVNNNSIEKLKRKPSNALILMSQWCEEKYRAVFPTMMNEMNLGPCDQECSSRVSVQIFGRKRWTRLIINLITNQKLEFGNLEKTKNRTYIDGRIHEIKQHYN